MENRGWKHRFVELGGAYIAHLTILAVASLTVAGVGALISTKIKALGEHAFPIGIGIGFAIGISVGVAALLLYYFRSPILPKFAAVQADFHVLHHEISYTYRDNDTIRYVKSKKIRALRSGLRTFRDKYHWTGSARPLNISSGNAQHRIRETQPHSVWNFYEIDLGETIAKGTVIETVVVWELDDSTKRSMPFVSATIEEPTDRLTFQLLFPERFHLDHIGCATYHSISANAPLDSVDVGVSSNGHAAWAPIPKLLHNYQVVWKFPDRD